MGQDTMLQVGIALLTVMGTLVLFIFHGIAKNIERLTRSVESLNISMAQVVSKVDGQGKEIETLQSRMDWLERK